MYRDRYHRSLRPANGRKKPVPDPSTVSGPTWISHLLPQGLAEGGVMGIEQDISAALAERAAQRDFIDGMAHDWQQLAGSFADLAAFAAAVGHGAARAQTADADQRAIFSDTSGYLAENASWPERTRSVLARLDACNAHVVTLHRRVYRETVNIGVIGITGAGKSTLLRRISGLSEEQIPSNEYTSTTAAPSPLFPQPASAPAPPRPPPPTSHSSPQP